MKFYLNLWLCPFKNKISSNYLVTKTDPVELNKWPRHTNCSTTIPAVLCYIRCIIRRNLRKEGSVFQNDIATLGIHSRHFENSTVRRYTSDRFLMQVHVFCAFVFRILQSHVNNSRTINSF
jgi:hypothetical protein